MVTKGDPIPDIQLETTPGETASLRTLAGDGVTVLFAVPGAFTPTCSATHLPGFVAAADEFKAAGATRILCVAPNDAFVTAAWAASIGGASGADAKVIVLADKGNALAAAWGVVLDAEGKLGTKRIKRLSAVLKDGCCRGGECGAGWWGCDVLAGRADARRAESGGGGNGLMEREGFFVFAFVFMYDRTRV